MALFAKPADLEKFCENLSEGGAGSERANAIGAKWASNYAGALGWRNLVPAITLVQGQFVPVYQYIKFNTCCDCEEFIVRVQAGFNELQANNCADIVLDVPLEIKNAYLCSVCDDLSNCGSGAQAFGDSRSSFQRDVQENWLGIRKYSLRQHVVGDDNRINLRLPNVQSVRVFKKDATTETYFTDDSFLDFELGEFIDIAESWDEETNPALNEHTDFTLRERDSLLCEVCYCEPCCN